VTIVATCSRIFRLSFLALAAKRQRWLFVNSHPPISDLFSKDAIFLDEIFDDMLLMLFIQPAMETTRKENGFKHARISAA